MPGGAPSQCRWDPPPRKKEAFGSHKRVWGEGGRIPHCAAASQEIPHPRGCIFAPAKPPQEGAAPPASPWTPSRSIPAASTTPHTHTGSCTGRQPPPKPLQSPQLLSAPSLDAVNAFGAPSYFPAFAELSRGSSPVSLHNIQNLYYYNYIFLGFFPLPQLPQPQAKGSRGSPVRWFWHSPTNPRPLRQGGRWK